MFFFYIVEGHDPGGYEVPGYQYELPADVTERHFIIRIAFPWQNFGGSLARLLSAVLGNTSSSGKVKLMDLKG